MHGIATFSIDDPEKIDSEIEKTRSVAAGGFPEEIPATGFLMLVDRERGKVV